LSDAPRKLYHADIDLPVAAGRSPHHAPVDSRHHRPIGPVDEITGVVFTANGQTIPWRATTWTSTNSTWWFPMA